MAKTEMLKSSFIDEMGRLGTAERIGPGNGSVTVDNSLSLSSTNPVQNKVISAALALKADATALNNKSDKPTVTTISGTTPTITPAANTIYTCGTLTSLTISNPPATGKFWIWFTSGATATTVTGIDNFTPEANKRYKITVEDNYATYDSWPYTQ